MIKNELVAPSKDGKVLWINDRVLDQLQFDINLPFMNTYLAVDEGGVIHATGWNAEGKNTTCAVSSGGSLLWTCPLSNCPLSPPMVDKNGNVLIVTADLRNGSFNAESFLEEFHRDGSPGFRISLGFGYSYASSSIAIGSDGKIYASNTEISVLTPNGTTLWKIYFYSFGTSIAIDAEDQVIASQGAVYRLGRNGILNYWQLPATADASSPAIGSGGTIYVIQYNLDNAQEAGPGKLFWVDKLLALGSDGTTKWTLNVGGNQNGRKGVD